MYSCILPGHCQCWSVLMMCKGLQVVCYFYRSTGGKNDKAGCLSVISNTSSWCCTDALEIQMDSAPNVQARACSLHKRMHDMTVTNIQAMHATAQKTDSLPNQRRWWRWQRPFHKGIICTIAVTLLAHLNASQTL